MASIDRYRSAGGRETYQPPVAGPGSSRTKSPTKRRDIPPAVPSPPSFSSRHSPPLSQSRTTASSYQSTPRTPMAPRNQWIFTSDEILSSPSVLDGISPAEERLRRAKGVNFIYQVGVLLELPQTTLYVAGVFFHRFYMRSSLVEEKHGVHHYVGLALSSIINLHDQITHTRPYRTLLRQHSFLPTRSKRTAGRPRTSSSTLRKSPRRTQSSLSMSSRKSTGVGEIASSCTRKSCWRVSRLT